MILIRYQFNRSETDRRSLFPRRDKQDRGALFYNEHYPPRSLKERRALEERRSGWKRIGPWSSVLKR